MNKINKKGFTLVELLVVIAIIGLLATIAVVSLSGSKNKGVQAKIQADLRGMLSAVEAENAANGVYPAKAATAGWINQTFGTSMAAGTVTAPAGVGYDYCITGSYYLLIATTTAANNSLLPTSGGVNGAVKTTAGNCASNYAFNSGGAVACTQANNAYCLSNSSTPSYF